MKHGGCSLRTLTVELAPGATARGVTAQLGGQPLDATLTQLGARVEITFAQRVSVKPGTPLEVTCQTT